MSQFAPLFIDDVAASAHSKLDRLIVQCAGPSCGLRIIAHEIAVSKSEVKKFDNPGVFAPGSLPVIQEYQKLHNAAIWTSLKYTWVPGTAAYGRTCTIHFGWSSLGQPAPNSREDFRNLAGYTRFSFGGIGDLTDRQLAANGPFNHSRDSIIFSSKLTIGVECRMYWWAEVADIGTVHGSGDLFAIEFLGEIELFGNVLA